jgi:hypothetical protein
VRLELKNVVAKHADAPHPLALLRARRERPCRRRAAEQRDEIAARPHSITSSARCGQNSAGSLEICVTLQRDLGVTISDNLLDGHQHRNPAIQEFRRQRGQAVVLTARPPEFEHHILALDEASFAQTAAECSDKVRGILR